MPDRATIEAATPKCPHVEAAVKNAPVEDQCTCGRPLEWNHQDFIWSCPEHGNILVPQVLVSDQNRVYAKAA